MKRLTFPWLTASITAATLTVYLVLEEGLVRAPSDVLVRQDGAVTAWSHLHPWSLAVAVFLHFSLGHVLSNMAALVLVGTLLEREMSRWLWFSAYMASGIVGNVVQSLLLPPHDLAAGASGAIMGLLGMLAVVWFRRRSRTNWPRLVGLLLLAGLEFAGELQAPAHIAMAAHWSGVAFGMALGWLVPSRMFRPPAPPIPVRVVRDTPPTAILASKTDPAVLQIAMCQTSGRRRVQVYVDGMWRGEIGRRVPALTLPLEPSLHSVVLAAGWVRFGYHVALDAGQSAEFQCCFSWFGSHPRITWATEAETVPVFAEEVSDNG